MNWESHCKNVILVYISLPDMFIFGFIDFDGLAANMILAANCSARELVELVVNHIYGALFFLDYSMW